ncbi:MAG: metallophosphoesterase family protein [Actinobacteria bacterium]|nr:metallophosphoesterase family protein [Actinomycetota bacterium]MCG2819466.1 metallophosphoesterase family protein [Actinomycetes bacterium]MBU4219346.1 metallophosphoesterase family protein [Actinomycetota bacterium]MBU4357882.1 metallophosphoesterase family protein [Actinomycetota bacterium]MBU4391053.1 metallophosphoesterase family protein [Actinomycetota bacterium]
MKKTVTILVILILAVSVAALSGCGQGDVDLAVRYKKAGDDLIVKMEAAHDDVETAEYHVSESYSAVVGQQQPGDNTLYPKFESEVKSVLSLLDSAKAEYEKILALDGVEDYKAYAKEMLECLQGANAWIESDMAMTSKMNEVITQFAQTGNAPDLAVEINTDREKGISFTEQSAGHYDAAYQIDKDKIHDTVPEDGRTPEHAHVSWREDPVKGVIVEWETGKWLKGYGANVKYGTASDNLSQTAKGPSFLYQYSDVEGHQATLSTTRPDTQYFYRCGSDGYGWSDVLSFRTSPAVGDGFTFCVTGDTRSASPKTSDVTEWGKVATAASTAKPLFTIINGDLVFLGFEDQLWPAWLDAAKPLMDSSVIMPCLGNHESYARGFFDRFVLPGNERWYSYDISDAHFICLDTGLMNYAEGPLLDEQVKWLTSDLERAKERGSRWTVVYTHRSPYSSGNLPDQPDIIASWVPIFDRFGVDLVIPSHVHYYERSFPMKGGQVVASSPSQYESPGGTIYMITGGGGVPLGDPVPAPWIASLAREFCYAVVEVPGRTGNTLKVQTKTPDGRVLDSFTVSK